MKKIKVGNTVCVCDKTIENYYGKVGKVTNYVHPYIYVVAFDSGHEAWFMAYQIVKGTSIT